MTLAILIPAAGASARLGGRDKLMETVDGQPLLRRQVLRALATGAPVYVTMRADRPARRAALKGLAVTLVQVKSPETGIAASIIAGIAAFAGDISAAMILLPDLPDLETGDMRRMMTAHHKAPQAVLRATSETGTPGHPTLFPRRLFADLAAISGDKGAASLLKTVGFTAIPLPGQRAVTDLDTPQDWALWRAARR